MVNLKTQPKFVRIVPLLVQLAQGPQLIVQVVNRPQLLMQKIINVKLLAQLDISNLLLIRIFVSNAIQAVSTAMELQLKIAPLVLQGNFLIQASV